LIKTWPYGEQPFLHLACEKDWEDALGV